MKTNTINAICTASRKCSGCQLKNLTYSEQLKLKQSKVNKALAGICNVERIVPAPAEFRYRNKASAVFFEDRSKTVRWGIYQSAKGEVAAVSQCLIQPEIADEIFNTLALLIKSFKIKIYNHQTKKGFLRSATVRIAPSTEQIMVTLVTSNGDFSKERQFVNALIKRHSEITTVVRSVYTGDAVIMNGEEEMTLYGDGYIEDKLCGKVFRISSRSFYQINSLQTQALYQKAIELASLDESSTFLDAYCGTGTIGIIASQNAKSAVGVEVNSAAVEDAKINARLNGADNMEFVCGDAGAYLEKESKKGNTFDVVFTDPPREGCSLKFLKSLCVAKPKKIVYVSCNPETQARDLRYLVKNGYEIKSATPFDMFPQTGHIETVVQLVRKIPDTHIDFEISLDEFDLTASEAKATYQEIKDYVLDKFGLKVSSLYISQVKTKCGIIERENYNKGEGKSRVPQCTPEKEKAIINAFRHFKMI
ncbi:MAG: 23S rRNA (uracil(1939)-C(5))-methyltransferase RlmD [Clostridia bacterium]|nr:23S rRNA (uracil(1939)-C(5))-methyltransferase RlmD [Clostridia bacterium]